MNKWTEQFELYVIRKQNRHLLKRCWARRGVAVSGGPGRFLKKVTFEGWMVRRRSEPCKILGKEYSNQKEQRVPSPKAEARVVCWEG